MQILFKSITFEKIGLANSLLSTNNIYERPHNAYARVCVPVFFTCNALTRTWMSSNRDMFKFWMSNKNWFCGLFSVEIWLSL